MIHRLLHIVLGGQVLENATKTRIICWFTVKNHVMLVGVNKEYCDLNLKPYLDFID